MNRERAGHPRLDDQPVGVELQDGVLGTPVHLAYGGAGQSTDEPASGNAPKNVIMAEGDPADGAADQCWSDVSNDGFDFGQFGHCRQGVTVTVPLIVG
jgi:hypothetical protein